MALHDAADSEADLTVLIDCMNALSPAASFLYHPTCLTSPHTPITA